MVLLDIYERLPVGVDQNGSRLPQFVDQIVLFLISCKPLYFASVHNRDLSINAIVLLDPDVLGYQVVGLLNVMGALKVDLRALVEHDVPIVCVGKVWNVRHDLVSCHNDLRPVFGLS